MRPSSVWRVRQGSGQRFGEIRAWMGESGVLDTPLLPRPRRAECPQPLCSPGGTERCGCGQRGQQRGAGLRRAQGPGQGRCQQRCWSSSSSCGPWASSLPTGDLYSRTSQTGQDQPDRTGRAVPDDRTEQVPGIPNTQGGATFHLTLQLNCSFPLIGKQSERVQCLHRGYSREEAPGMRVQSGLSLAKLSRKLSCPGSRQPSSHVGF